MVQESYSNSHIFHVGVACFFISNNVVFSNSFHASIYTMYIGLWRKRSIRSLFFIFAEGWYCLRWWSEFQTLNGFYLFLLNLIGRADHSAMVCNCGCRYIWREQIYQSMLKQCSFDALKYYIKFHACQETILSHYQSLVFSIHKFNYMALQLQDAPNSKGIQRLH